MKAAPATRPARRIPAARFQRLQAAAAALAAEREAAWQARQDELAQLVSPTPEFTEAPRLTMLPGGLHWSAAQQVPAVGATVQVQQVGPAQVTGYCHAAGFLGLVVEPARGTSRPRRAQAARARCVFGSQLALAA